MPMSRSGAEPETPKAPVRMSNERGLQPVRRRIWVEQEEHPVAVVNWKREWLWLYAFVQPKTGETKRVDSALCQHARCSAEC